MAFDVQTRKLYNNQVELHFNPRARNRYQLSDGTAPVGVTTILSKVLAKEALMLWPMYQALGYLKEKQFVQGLELSEVDFEEATKAHVKKSDKGKDVGSLVHEAIENYLNIYALKSRELELGTELLADKQAYKAYRAFVSWFETADAKVLATEQIVYSRKHNFAGTFDALLEIDGQIVLSDIKTSNVSRTAPKGIYSENFLQLGAYSLAYEEAKAKEDFPNDQDYIDDLMIINAGKTGELNTLRASELGLSVRDCEDAFLAVLAVYRFNEPLKKLIKEGS